MIVGVVENSLYVEDLERATEFYREVLGLALLNRDERFAAFNVAGRQVLLLFKRGASTEPMTMPGGTIPPHDGSGTTHIGFAVAASSLSEWERRLSEHQVVIESRVTWPRGGMSLYFRDPDGHLLEILTPGVWTIY
jgi:catechol 2,3-dioxygenase-like lactoylglutathione lyase family enzyme